MFAIAACPSYPMQNTSYQKSLVKVCGGCKNFMQDTSANVFSGPVRKNLPFHVFGFQYQEKLSFLVCEDFQGKTSVNQVQ